MVEILSKDDIQKVDAVLQEYLEYSFARLYEGYQYPEYGYFIVIEKFQELLHPLNIKEYHIPSISNAAFFKRYIELVEIHKGIVEIVLLLDNDFGVSLIMKEAILPADILSRLKAIAIEKE